ncbi:MAG: sugar ABC transporter permease [Burkholderiales bacterium PBB3]|nr:MAG: sugar ABC transporter permease [Burkholderiales bacterium PBB3]
MNCWVCTLKHLFDYLLPYRHWGLIRQFAGRDVAARYRQSWLGTVWLVLTPLLMLGVYTFVFRNVMKQKWFGLDESNLSFALRIYAGLAVFNFFAECVNRAPNLVREQPHLVKKVVFPLEVLSWVNVCSALVGLAVSMLLLVGLSAWELGSLQWTALALPLVWLPLLPLCVGLGWLLSAIGTYVQDVGQLLGAALSALMFLSPIFFPVEALPEAARGLMFLNPLALVMSQTREVLLLGQWPDWALLGWQFVACMAVAFVGAAFFKTARVGFADVV